PNTLAKFANGICANLLTAVYLSARSPVFLAPAMDLDMLAHPSTRSNLDRLRSCGIRLIDTAFGDPPSGLTGDGRMAEPDDIVKTLGDFFAREQKLHGKHAPVTAGPTHEAIDPVRY